MALITLLIHLPPIQNYISDRITTYLTEGTGYTTEIDYINIKWFNAISVDGTRIYDEQNVKMIGIDELVLTFRLGDLIGKRDIQTKEAWVKGADVNLRKKPDFYGLNIDHWAIEIAKLTAPSEVPSTPVEPAAFSIDKITLLESKFSISDSRRDSLKTEGFDYNHFQLLDLNADLLNLKAVADTFQIDVKYLTTRDSASDMKIDALSTFFRNSQKQMAFLGLDLQMGKTHLTDEVIFDLDRPSDMGYFVDSVDIRVNFDKAVLHTDELSHFVPEFKESNERVLIDGFFEGQVRNFFSDNFRIDFGDDTSLRGALQMEGLPNINETYFTVTLENSRISALDFKEYIGSRTFNISSKLGNVGLNGSFLGFVNSFVADGDFKTELGDFTSNTQIEIVEGQLPQYKGELIMADFDLGAFTEEQAFQKVDMDGTIEGYGFTLEEANFDLKAYVSRIGINGYDYLNITTDGQFAQSFFEGDIQVEDPNIVLFAQGSVDLRDNKSIFKIEGMLDTARLDVINVMDEKVLIATEFELDASGLKLDSILGNIYLTDTYLKYQDRDIQFDSLKFSSKRYSGQRQVRFSSDQFNVALDGNFEFSGLAREISNINEQYRLVFSSRMEQVEEFLASHQPPKEPFDIRYRLDLTDISPVLQLFDTSLYVSKGAAINGQFSNSTSEDFALNAYADTVKWANVWFIRDTLSINSTDLRDASEVQTLGYLNSEKQIFANTSETENLVFDFIWEGNEINITQNLGQESSGNYAAIGANVRFYPDTTVLRFEDSNLQALGEDWKITRENKVIFGERRIDIKNLSVYKADESIQFDGEVAVTKDSSKTLGIEFKNVSVANINSLTSKTYTGNLNGSLKAQNLYFNPLLFGTIDLKDLKVNNFLVGDLSGSLTWNDLRKKFDLDFEVDRLDKKIVALTGDFFPSNPNNQLSLDLHLEDANLKIAELFIAEYFSEIKGFMDGDYKITGLVNAPVMTGRGNLKSGQMKVNYLNTVYDFNGAVEFKQNLIELINVDFADPLQNSALFNGNITHNSFSDIQLNLSGELNRFQVLNTTQEDGDVYYGSAFATGTVELLGEASNLTIAAQARTEPDTRIFIPISEGQDETDTPDYITFIDRTDTAKVVVDTPLDEVQKIKIEGLNLDLDIEVTPDAYVEIIIDPKSGDIIRGRGNGQLRLQIDNQGEFQMTGELSIVEGGYNFSLYNIITKEFQIEQPSSITWFGDPYSAIMDINASYSQSTSLQPILEQTGFATPGTDNGAVTRRFPTKVLLSLQGPMLSPEIDFDIDFSQIQGQENQVAIDAFKNRLSSDEQELNRQVLSLIVLNRFSDQGGITIGGNTTTQNVSQLLSNQLSQLVAQLDENLEVDFDLADLDQDAFNTFQLRLSYTFLDGRLRITREGGLAGDVNSIAGDWTAEYLLTTDGRYKVKVYSRNNYDLTNLANAQNATSNTTGASITQTTSFNNFKEFFSGVNRKRKKRRSENEKEKSDPDSGNL